MFIIKTNRDSKKAPATQKEFIEDRQLEITASIKPVL